MSISDYILEGGWVPGYSEHLYDAYNVSDATKENREKLWKQLCNDQRWKHKEDLTKEELKCGQNTETFGRGDWTATYPLYEPWHIGAQAPKWVWESTPIKLEKETEENYLQRLVCVVCGRFVCLTGINTQDNDKGIPQVAERYSWRYWDNEGHVYQDTRLKWTTYPGDEVYTGNMQVHSKPGEFDAKPLWMFDDGRCCREFYDVVWRWKHGVAIVEELDILAKKAGIDINSSNTVLDEYELDTLASGKGWMKITSINQPNMASYRKDEQRINFYLTTGTVGTCLDHPTQYKTQLFRRGVDMKEAAILLDNPREHTGRGYKRKATHDIVPARRCDMCFADNLIIHFSKNQRSKGSKAKCNACVQKCKHAKRWIK